MSNKSHISIGQRTKKAESNKLGWEISNRIPSDEVCVIVLGGSGSISHKKANGYLKFIENDIIKSGAISETEEDIKLYGVIYNFGQKIKKAQSRAILFKKYGRNVKVDEKFASVDENNDPAYIKDIYDKIIKERITSKEGEKLGTDEACRNIRKISFVAHCHGAYTALKLEEVMQEEMKNLGYSSNEREKIQKNLFILAHAPAAPLGVSKSTLISFCSANDTKGEFHGNHFHSHIRDNAKKEEFNLPLSYLNDRNEKMFLVKKIRKFSFLKTIFSKENDHDFLGYNTTKEMTPDGKVFTYLSKNILTNAIKNSISQKKEFVPIPEVEELVLGKDKKRDGELFSKIAKNGKDFCASVHKGLRDIFLSRNKRTV